MSALENLGKSWDGVSVNIGGFTLHLGDLTALPTVVGFSLSASLLAVVNKFALVVFPFPALLTALQYLTSVLGVLILGQLKVLEHDPLSWDMCRKFMPAAIVYYLSLFTNMHLLQVSGPALPASLSAFFLCSAFRGTCHPRTHCMQCPGDVGMQWLCGWRRSQCMPTSSSGTMAWACSGCA